MKAVIHCPCGYVVRADSEEELVARAQEHARETHNLVLTQRRRKPWPGQSNGCHGWGALLGSNSRLHEGKVEYGEGTKLDFVQNLDKV